jgi:AcrR family transcriptional regulator
MNNLVKWSDGMQADSVRRLDRRKLRTRAALLNAGRTLLATRAIDGISIDEIVVADVA